MRWRWVAALFVGFAQAGFAQTVHGTVVADGDRPVRGVVVALVDAASKEVARALTNDAGEYRLVAPGPGSYRLRTLRIGFKSVMTPPMALAAGDDIVRRLAVSTVVFSLDTVRAIGRNSCKVVAGDSTSVVAAIWDQVRNALIATKLSMANNTIFTTAIAYDRMVDVRSHRVGSQMLDIRSHYVAQPWRSLSADSLRKGGYVYAERDGSRTYHSPDLSVLVSDEFIEDHCLRVSKESDDRRLGIDFEPTPARRNVSEIRGTLWLDRRTNELQAMEHRYLNRILPDEERVAGGEMGFTRMANGLWTITRWNIHMPILVSIPITGPGLTGARREIKVDSMKVTGGELVMATTTGTRRDTIWMRPPLTLRGVVVDSLTGAPVRDAVVGLTGTIQLDTTDASGRFVIGGVLPGRYTVNTATPSLDSLNTTDQRTVLFADSSMTLTVRVPSAQMLVGSACTEKNTATQLGTAILFGSVARADGSPARNADVVAKWDEVTIGAGVVADRAREAQTRADARGRFRICGLPAGTVYFVAARVDSTETKPFRVEFGKYQSFARADLVIGAAPASLSSTPVRSVERDTAPRAVAAGDLMGEFEAHRRIGIGYFLTREEIDKRASPSAASLLQAMPGVRILSGSSGEWAYNPNQRCQSLVDPTSDMGKAACSTLYAPTVDEARQGLQTRCYTRVYVDYTLMNAGTPTPPYNLRELTSYQIQAVEYYSQPAQVPAKYRALDVSCGLVIFHTRSKK